MWMLPDPYVLPDFDSLKNVYHFITECYCSPFRNFSSSRYLDRRIIVMPFVDPTEKCRMYSLGLLGFFRSLQKINFNCLKSSKGKSGRVSKNYEWYRKWMVQQNICQKLDWLNATLIQNLTEWWKMTWVTIHRRLCR